MTMTIRQAASLSALLLAAAAQAANRTWDGGGSDANWSTVANWDGDLTAPVADDALLFGGASKVTNTNDLPADTSFAGITFNSGAGAFSLWGNSLTLGGDVLNSDGDTQTLNMPLALSATRTFTAASGNLALSNTVSGAGGLTKEGNAALFLTGNNTYDGVTSINTGTVYIAHANALGSTNGNTVINTARGASLNIRGNLMTLAEPITANGGNVNRNCILNETGTNTISGPLTTSGGRYNANGGTWLKITGGVTGPNPFFVVNANGVIEFTTTPITIGTGTFHSDSGGLTILGVASNVWGNTLFTGGTLRMDVANAMPAATALQIGGVSYGPNATWNLNGFDQTIASITRAGTTAGTVAITSAVPATLTINQSTATTYEGQLSGMVNLVKTGTGTLSLSNALSSTVGAFTVSNGTLLVTAGSKLGNSTNILVAGGFLELQNQTALHDAAALMIQNGGKLRVGTGLSERVDRLYLNGVQQPSGVYGSSASGALFTNDTYFTGNGKLVVWSSPPIAAVGATWDAGGGADTLVSTALNWTNDAAPLFDGTTRATFATGGATATVDTAVGLYGMIFNRDGNFTLAAGAGLVTNGAGGIFAQVPNTTGRTYTIAEDLLLGDNQTWFVTNNSTGGTTLNVTGAIDDGFVPYCITKGGNGTLTLSSSNAFDGAVVVTGGTLRVNHAYALGSTNGSTTVMGLTGGYLVLGSNLNIAEPLILNGEFNNGGTVNSSSGSNTLSGPLTIYNQVRFQAQGGVLTVSGGATAMDGSALFVINSSATMIFSGLPLNLGPKTFYTDSGGLTVLATSGNTWADTMVANGQLRLDVPNALPAASTLRLGIGYGPSGTLNLNGNNQTVSRLYLAITNAGTRVITSPTPAVLTVNQTVNDTIDAQFTGAASLLKAGIGTLIMTNAFTSTTGYFAVSNGTLVVSGTGTFGTNSTNLFVGGTGTLLLSNSVSIANSAVVRMPDLGTSTAKINLAAGVNETVGWLTYGSKLMRLGTYGSSASAAFNKDDTHFAGTGVLTVLHDRSGTMITVR